MAVIEKQPNASFVESNDDETEGPKRVLGIWSACSMVTGGMIGSGIFFLPQLVMGYSGSVGLFLLVWVLCGIVAFIGGLCWVELGLTFPKSGGEYMLINETLGPIPAFCVIWLRLIIIQPASMAIQRFAIADYLIQPFFPDCSGREDLVPILKLIALACLCAQCLINIVSTTWSVRIIVVFTVCKILSLLIVMGMGVYGFAKGTTNSFTNAFEGTTADLGTIALGLQSCLWAYEGWDLLNDVNEDVKKPAKTMPWAVLGSVSMVTLFYLVVNMAYLAILNPQEIKLSPATAANVVERIFSPSVRWVVPLLVSVSIFGSTFAGTFTIGRIVFSAAREGHLPQFLAMVHPKERTPIPVYILMIAIVFIMIVSPNSSIKNLLRLMSTAIWIINTLTVLGMLWTRYRRPRTQRPFKLPIVVPVFFQLISLYLAIAPFIRAPIESSISVLPILAGLPVYYLFIYRKATPKCILELFDWIAYKCQVVFNVRLPSTYDDYQRKE